MKYRIFLIFAVYANTTNAMLPPIQVPEPASASAARADRLDDDDDDDDGPSDPKRFKVRPTPGPVPGKTDFERKPKRIVDVCDVAKPKPAHCKK